MTFLFDVPPPPDWFHARVPRGLVGRTSLLPSLGEVLPLPGFFGRSWDALYDLITDFDWIDAPGVALLHEELPQLDERDLRIYLELLRDATVEYVDVPFVAVFPGSAREEIQRQLASSR